MLADDLVQALQKLQHRLVEFLLVRVSGETWIDSSRAYRQTIGCHRFYL